MYNHTAILTRDLDQSKHFYEQLGLSVLRTWEKPDQGLSAVVMKHPQGTILELIHSTKESEFTLPSRPELLHIGFSVQSISETLGRLGDAKILKPITPGVSVQEFAFVADPSGFPVELVTERL